MTNQNITNKLLGKNNITHKVIPFVNTTMFKDVKLFIDPVLIENGASKFCKDSKIVVEDYFNELFSAYYDTNDISRKRYLLKHAQEINDSHLGYASSHGHGNTEDGLLEIFSGVDDFISSLKLYRSFELVLFVPGFAEDGMSDLLTNILYKELSDFTINQCKKYNFKTSHCNKDRYYWDISNHSWKKYVGESLIINDEIYLLIPKEIVQSHYRFTADNFLRSVIVENICKALSTFDPTTGKLSGPGKDKTREDLLKKHGSHYNTLLHFAQSDNSLLKQYHSVVDNKYKTKILTDSELDNILYSA